jgi:signal transduction histidine kinase
MSENLTQSRSLQPALNEIAQLAAQICQTPFALINFFEEGHQSVLAAVGLDREAIPLQEGFCSQVKDNGGVLTISDTLAEPTYATNPAVVAPPHIRFYMGIALKTPKGSILGTLSVLDQCPRQLSSSQMATLHSLSHEIVRQLELQRYVEELEQTLHQRTQELASTLVLAEAANQHKTEFLASISHELRTPLTTILGFARLLRDRIHGDLNPKQMQYIDLIHSSGQHLLDLINDLLDLGKVEAGRMELDLQPVSPVDLCKRVIRLLQARAVDKNITLSFENRLPDRLKTALLDDRKMYQILVNLVSNAIKFTPAKGRVTLRLSLEKSSMLHFSVIDTGIGIPLEKQGKVFEAFYQVENAKQRQAGGTGLGLSLCRQFAKLMNGSIELESQVKQGSTFTVKIPLHANPIAQPSQMSASKNLPRSGT